MATNYTTNYDLCQWEPTDPVQRVEFNADNVKLDAALKSLSDQVVQKANQSALNTLVTAVNQKANQTDLTAAVGRISALEGGKANQTSLDQVEAALRAENGLVHLTQVALASSVSSYSLTVPDWDDAWELQIRYNLTGTGEFRMMFNSGATLYNLSSGDLETSIRLKREDRTACCGVIFLQPCGSDGRLFCHIRGAVLNSDYLYSSMTHGFYGMHDLSPASLDSIQFQATGGPIQAGGTLGIFKVK